MKVLVAVSLYCQTFLDISCLCYRQDGEAIMEKCGDQLGLFNPLEAQFHFLTSNSLNRTTCTLLTYKLLRASLLLFKPVILVSSRFSGLPGCIK